MPADEYMHVAEVRHEGECAMLEAIGLSSLESRVYVALIDNPRSSASDMASNCEITTGTAARVLGGLTRRGMASRLAGKPTRYVAIAPDLAVQPLYARHEEDLLEVRKAIHDLVLAFHQASRQARPAQLVEVVTGTKNITNRALALQDGARRSMSAFVKPPYVMGTASNYDREVRRLAEGIEYRALYQRDDVVDALEDVRMSVLHGEQARVVAELPIKLWIADDNAALIPMRSTTFALDIAFVVHPSALLDGLLALFEREWERATPVRFGADIPAMEESRPGEATTTLLAMLAAGVTDEAMARSLGLSLRTLQRRIQALMRDLNATTRFQAGMKAKERGWL